MANDFRGSKLLSAQSSAVVSGRLLRLIHRRKFQTVAEAEQAIFHYIEVYYNRQRKHSTNGYKAPALYELEWGQSRKVA